MVTTPGFACVMLDIEPVVVPTPDDIDRIMKENNVLKSTLSHYQQQISSLIGENSALNSSLRSSICDAKTNREKLECRIAEIQEENKRKSSKIGEYKLQIMGLYAEQKKLVCELA